MRWLWYETEMWTTGQLDGNGGTALEGIFCVLVGCRCVISSLVLLLAICFCWQWRGREGVDACIGRGTIARFREQLPALITDGCLLTYFWGVRVLLLQGLRTELWSPLPVVGRQVFLTRSDVKTKKAPRPQYTFCPSCPAHGRSEVDPHFSCHGGVLTSKHISHLFPSQLNSIRLEGQNVEEGKTVWFVSHCAAFTSLKFCWEIMEAFCAWESEASSDVLLEETLNNKPRNSEFVGILSSVFLSICLFCLFLCCVFPSNWWIL